jgi:hypothetical protein
MQHAAGSTNSSRSQVKILPSFQRSDSPLCHCGDDLLTVCLQAQQEHDDAKEVFDLLNDQLIAELPQLLDLRVPFFDPSFEAMIRMQCKFAEEGYEKLGGVQRYVALSRPFQMFGAHGACQILCG